jgi:hypothetical protein
MARTKKLYIPLLKKLNQASNALPPNRIVFPNLPIRRANIISSGHSKGRFMTMVAATSLGNPDIKFSVMAAYSP